MKFSDYIEEWKAKARNRTSESWKIGQEQVLRAHILPYLGHKNLKSITPSDITDVLLASQNKNHSLNQQKKIYMVLSKVFSDAIHFFDLLTKSPVKKRFHLPEKPKDKERPYLSYEQALILLEYCMNDPHYGIPVWISILAGPRISELQLLEWTDIDFKNDSITINKSHCNTTGKDRDYTKNKNDYEAPLNPMLKKFLLERRKLKGLVCNNFTGGMLSRFSFGNYLRRIAKHLKFPVIASHGLRHTCARIYVELGASDEQISELLGHKHLLSSKPYVHRKGVSRLKALSKKIA